MSGSGEAHQAVSEIMQRQAPGAAPGTPLPAEHSPEMLPLRVAYVDEASGRLVVGIDHAATADRAQHERTLRDLVGEAELEVRYVGVTRDACPSKKEDCRPLRGGVRMNGDATLSLVVIQLSGEERVVRTITSGHAVGNGTGQSVGQSASASKYGKVLVNPSLARRASDAALTDISNARIEGSPYTIWRGNGVADFVVNDFAISSNTPVNLVVYMQGAMDDALRTGKILQKGVTVTDQRGTLTGQVYASYPAEGGDSGAPVFYRTEFDSYVVYVGLHAGRVIEAGDTVSFYSPWEGIRQDLGLDRLAR